MKNWFGMAVIACMAFFVTVGALVLFLVSTSPVFPVHPTAIPIAAPEIAAAPPAPAIEPCDEHGAQWAVLDKLNPILNLDTSEPFTLDDVVENERKVACIRDWAKQNVKDPCVMDAYETWIEVYFRHDAAARKQLSDPRHEDDYEKDRRKEKEEKAAFTKTHKIPVPSADQCDLKTIRELRKK